MKKKIFRSLPGPPDSGLSLAACGGQGIPGGSLPCGHQTSPPIPPPRNSRSCRLRETVKLSGGRLPTHASEILKSSCGTT